MTSELKTAAIVAIHGNDDASFVELAPVVKPMSDARLQGEANLLAFKIRTNYVGHCDAAIEQMIAVNRGTEWIMELAKRYADSQRGCDG